MIQAILLTFFYLLAGVVVTCVLFLEIDSENTAPAESKAILALFMVLLWPLVCALGLISGTIAEIIKAIKNK